MDPERVPVWTAMAELFLDTDVRLHFAHVARAAAASPYGLEELERIFAREVAPILEHNLLDVAGEWAMFPEEWLVDAIRTRLATDPPPYRLRTDVLATWRRVVHLVTCLRALPAAERDGRARLWDALRGAFLDGMPPAAAQLDAGTRDALLAEMRPAFGPD